ncbi:MAG: alpha/beta hydrolase [Bacteroidetes bacterium]|nr:alpha/beta hydrolase [Bacteroidota bacterium]
MPYLETNNIRLHYLQGPKNGPLLFLLHGLTANAHAFDGIREAGLDQHYEVVAVDLRGRGLSDHPAFDYSMEDHAQDILGLMAHFKADRVAIVGHSFGGLLGYYLSANYPEKVARLVALDAAARMNPMAAEMLAVRLSKLDVRYPSFAAYLEGVKSAPYNTFWSPEMLSYYKADVRPHDEGGVTPRPQLANIIAASLGVAAIPWPELIPEIKCPVLLVNAPEEYTMGMPLLPDDLAEETVEMLADGKLVTVDGNHQTMLYGSGAQQIVAAIIQFMGKQ